MWISGHTVSVDSIWAVHSSVQSLLNTFTTAFVALIRHQDEHSACKNWPMRSWHGHLLYDQLKAALLTAETLWCDVHHNVMMNVLAVDSATLQRCTVMNMSCIIQVSLTDCALACGVSPVEKWKFWRKVVLLDNRCFIVDYSTWGLPGHIWAGCPPGTLGQNFL